MVVFIERRAGGIVGLSHAVYTELAANQTFLATAPALIAGLTQTLPNNAGKSIITFCINFSNNTTGAGNRFRIKDGATFKAYQLIYTDVGGNTQTISVSYVADNDGQDIALEAEATSGTMTVNGGATYKSTSMQIS